MYNKRIPEKQTYGKIQQTEIHVPWTCLLQADLPTVHHLHTYRSSAPPEGPLRQSSTLVFDHQRLKVAPWWKQSTSLSTALWCQFPSPKWPILCRVGRKTLYIPYYLMPVTQTLNTRLTWIVQAQYMIKDECLLHTQLMTSNQWRHTCK